MEWGGNLCLHIHLINQSDCSLYMCICIYFYLLKCFRLLVTEKAFINLHNKKTQSRVPPGLDNSIAQLCHQEDSFEISFFLLRLLGHVGCVPALASLGSQGDCRRYRCLIQGITWLPVVKNSLSSSCVFFTNKETFSETLCQTSSLICKDWADAPVQSNPIKES